MLLVSLCACLHSAGRCILILQRKERGRLPKWHLHRLKSNKSGRLFNPCWLELHPPFQNSSWKKYALLCKFIVSLWVVAHSHLVLKSLFSNLDPKYADAGHDRAFEHAEVALGDSPLTYTTLMSAQWRYRQGSLFPTARKDLKEKSNGRKRR